MYKNFPISRLGNKYLDIKYIIPYLPKSIDNIIEPFAGSYALIRYISDKDPKDRELTICETDKEFINALKTIYKNPAKLIAFYEEFNQYITDNKYKRDDNQILLGATKQHKQIIKKMMEKHNMPDSIYETNLAIRGIFKKKPVKLIESYKNNAILFNKIKVLNDFHDIYDNKSYWNNSKNFIFFDPPYFLSHNKTYNLQTLNNENHIIDNTTIYLKILEMLQKSKCKIMLVVNKNALMHHLFKAFYKGEYSKNYNIYNKIEILGIYCNY